MGDRGLDGPAGGVPPPVETWRLEHPDRGLIEVHVGPAARLAELDPGFPVGEKEAVTRDAADEDDEETRELKGKLRKLGLDDVPRRILVTLDGRPMARLKDLANAKISCKDKHLEGLENGKFTESLPAFEAPRLKIESNFLDSWVRTIIFQDEGQPGVELDPPQGSRAADRYAAMAASPWKRVVYPLLAGLSKGGWALGIIFLGPLIAAIIGPLIAWLRSLLPDWEIDIPWPDIDWPDWRLPAIELPGWVEFLAEYSRVWVPVLIGLVIGAIAVRRYRKSREAKRAWQERLDNDAPEGDFPDDEDPGDAAPQER